MYNQDLSFLIITYGNKYLEKCIESIRKFYNDVLICIVDNNLNSNINLKKYNNIRYSKNNGNYYELGSIWFATKKWKDINKFIIIHNSMIMISKFPKEILNKKYISLWAAKSSDYSPVIPLAEKKLKEANIILKYNGVWDSICGCCCIIETKILYKLIDNGMDKIYAKTKNEAVSTEIIFGYLINIYLNIKEKPLHKYPIYTYIQKKEKYIWIDKIGTGQGKYKNPETYIIDQNLFSIIKISNDKNEYYINLIKYVNLNNNIGNMLIKSYPKNISTGIKILNTCLSSIRHRMFTKKYFPDYYKKEYEDIINKRKIMC